MAGTDFSDTWRWAAAPAAAVFSGIFKPSAACGVYDRMPKNSRDSGAQKFELHGEGVGELSQADIDRRARELALIDGRTEVTAGDREQALAEFRDNELPATINEDADSMQSMSRDPSDPIADRGRQAPEYGGDDEKAALERLALEGVEEAQHEQMLESRNYVDEPLRSRPKSSGSE